jgi:ribonuclease E
MPRSRKCAILYEGKIPLFTKYNLDREIELIQRRHVPLKIGGSIVIDSTEALVAIDVNSGKYRDQENAEITAYKINMEAAQEVARQLRLRDLGGVIVIDFIDMTQDKHRRDVEKALRDAVSCDRANTKVLRISQFGLVEMTRQRIKPSLKSSTYIDCPHCKGAGVIKSPESASIEIMRSIQYAAEKNNVSQIEVRTSLAVANYLQNRKRNSLAEMETKAGKAIVINGDPALDNGTINVIARDARGIEINLAV